MTQKEIEVIHSHAGVYSRPVVQPLPRFITFPRNKREKKNSSHPALFQATANPWKSHPLNSLPHLVCLYSPQMPQELLIECKQKTRKQLINTETCFSHHSDRVSGVSAFVSDHTMFLRHSREISCP